MRHATQPQGVGNYYGQTINQDLMANFSFDVIKNQKKTMSSIEMEKRIGNGRNFSVKKQLHVRPFSLTSADNNETKIFIQKVMSETPKPCSKYQNLVGKLSKMNIASRTRKYEFNVVTGMAGQVLKGHSHSDTVDGKK